ncbi:magnesium transporter CorA family protein [Elstera sp.]|jgi:magnesium transporter|uniref:magnesium transporter CorA family protein n=1 Tax=Elstera sp. TaxID=1916664 RepID=UPI0037C04804
MLTLFLSADAATQRLPLGELPTHLPPAMWYDLLEPTTAEIHAVQRSLGIELPSREEMQEIEVSSRLYEEDGALFMTVSIMSKFDSGRPETNAVTFVLTPKALVTVRYADPLPFIQFANRVQRNPTQWAGSDTVWTGLLETLVDRVADVLERISADLERTGQRVFDSKDAKGRTGVALEEALSKIGRSGQMVSGISESLMTLNRAIAYAGNIGGSWLSKDARNTVKMLTRDIKSLHDHAGFLSQKVNFLLDATLGLINIEQNSIIKIFTVASVAFLPPTLIASIYGMNFEIQPELKWDFGYPMAIMLMILSALGPYLYFKRKGWI